MFGKLQRAAFTQPWISLVMIWQWLWRRPHCWIVHVSADGDSREDARDLLEIYVSKTSWNTQFLLITLHRKRTTNSIIYCFHNRLKFGFFSACAPQPTEDSSSPTDIAQGPPPALATPINNDGLDAQNIHLPPSDSDEKDDGIDPPRLPCKLSNSVRLLGTLESDSLNETFSPAR